MGCKDLPQVPRSPLSRPLLSLGKLTAFGCSVAFTGDTVTVINPDGVVILICRKPHGRNIYTVPLPTGQCTQPVPTTIITAPKIGRDTQANHIKPSIQHIEPSTKKLKMTRENKVRGFTSLEHKNSHNSANDGVRSNLRPVLNTTTSTLRKYAKKASSTKRLPPPRPHKLTILVPKYQSAYKHHSPNLQFTPDELGKYCDWVPMDKIHTNTTIQEASLCQTTSGLTHTANAAAG